MAQAFNIQAPENIAKEYAGNKQKIAQAAQIGILDPTAAVLAGMFIDRMRSAQVMEATPQQTVAQQVLGAPGQGQPQGGIPPAPAGMGAPPQQMGAPAPLMEAPMPQMEGPPPEMEAPMGMAEGGMVPPYASGGGLSDLPVPDGMFDEPSNGGFNDGYAGGGMVAFAPGGEIDAARLRRALMMQESDGDYGLTNRGTRGRPSSGAMGAYQFMPPTAKALSERIGEEYRPDLMTGDKGRSKEGKAYQDRLMDAQMEDVLAYSGGDVSRAATYHFGGPNERIHGADTRKYAQEVMGRYSGSKDTGEMPERDFDTAQGRTSSLTDNYEAIKGMFAPSEREQEIDARRTARAEEMSSPEYYKKERKADMWQTLAEIGFNMASSKSPSLLQAVGEAASAAMPGARADKKERKAAQDRALDIMGEMNDKKRKENRDYLGMAVDATNIGIKQGQFGQELEIKRAELKQQQDEFDTRRDEAKQAAIAAGLKFDIDKFLYNELAAGGTQAIIAEKFMRSRYGGKGPGGGPFNDELNKDKNQNPSTKYQ